MKYNRLSFSRYCSMALIGLLSLFMLTACVDEMSNRDAGVITGGIIGGVVGHQFGGGSGRMVATTIGAIAGSMIGGNIGAQMDARDRAQMLYAVEHAQTGHHTVWVNPDTGSQFDVVPTKTYEQKYRSSTQPCREYTTTATIGGKREKIYGRACRMDDGSWKIIK